MWPSACIIMYLMSQLRSTSVSNGNQQEDKRAEKSITEVSFFTIIMQFSQCMRATMVQSESLQAFPMSCEVFYITLDYAEQFFPYQQCNNVQGSFLNKAKTVVRGYVALQQSAEHLQHKYSGYNMHAYIYTYSPLLNFHRERPQE